MFQGKTKAALDILRSKEMVKLDDHTLSGNGSSVSVTQILNEKHPPGQPAVPGSLVDDEAPPIHDVIYDPIDAALIRSAALKTSGASGIDAHGWRRLCTCYYSISRDLCQALADMAKHLCAQFIDPSVTAPFFACRLNALDKRPGVRPIEIGDTVMRIIAKAVLMAVRGDVLDVAGSIQLCAGQIAGTETAVHAVHFSFASDDCEALLLVDASNAFNALNCQTALRNIMSLCPSLATVLINSYRAETDLFVGNDVIKSCEGTT